MFADKSYFEIKINDKKQGAESLSTDQNYTK